MAMNPIRSILCPTDFSCCSRQAFHVAAALARAHGARLVVLHVKQTFGPLVAYGEMLAGLAPAEYDAKLDEVLHKFNVSDGTVPVEHRLAEGDTVDQILEAARQGGCDLIVMGTHGRKGLGRVLLGSVSGQILARARCPVVTVREAHPHDRPNGHRSPALARLGRVLDYKVALGAVLALGGVLFMEVLS
jgi:nucleotide-binding universal stress UspA family protein